MGPFGWVWMLSFPRPAALLFKGLDDLDSSLFSDHWAYLNAPAGAS
jgi:hypothetical protein